MNVDTSVIAHPIAAKGTTTFARLVKILLLGKLIPHNNASLKDTPHLNLKILTVVPK